MLSDAVISPLSSPLSSLLTDTTRLYRLQGEGVLSHLLVESWRQHEALDAPWLMQLDALSTDPLLDVHAMLGQPITLWTRLADGSEHPRAGLVTRAVAHDYDAALARYRLTIEPWLGLLVHGSHSRAWLDQPFTAVIDSVLAAYPHANWAWAECIEPHLAASAGAGLRSYTVQYRETDLAFVHRLLAREGIAYRIESPPEAAAGRIVFFADSVSKTSCPEDPISQSTLGGAGIRYHRAASQEDQDAVQALGAQRSLPAADVTALAWDEQAKRAVAVGVPTAALYGGANAPRLEHYIPNARAGAGGHHAYTDTQQAQRAASLIAQALEARHKTWFGRSSVRSFSPGRHFSLTQSPLDGLAGLDGSSTSPAATPEPTRFLLTAVTHSGINNLPKDRSAQIARRLGPPDQVNPLDPLDPFSPPCDPRLQLPPDVLAQAAASGYANHFQAIRAAIPWRPEATGRAPRGAYPGLLSATVVGADGTPSGSEPLHMDRWGRIRIAFDFQLHRHSDNTSTPTSTTSPWVRVLQRWAGPGMGAQFIPRIGQQVLVDFVDGDIEQPVVIASLYDGRGEGGVARTPGGQAGTNGSTSDTSVFANSGDHRSAGQANLSGGHSPAWHGASPQDIASGGQRNAAALSGYKSEEFGGAGFNQLVFDDSDQQLRTQLATTQHATHLSIGHLVHQADNHRGSLRGLGFELRTDAYGAVRGGHGVLLSTYATQGQEPAGDNAAGIALQGQLATLAGSFSTAAGTHQITRLASHIGSLKANAGTISGKEPPAKALHTAVKGMVSETSLDEAQSDAANKNTSTGEGKLPASTDPTVIIAAKAGQATTAGQDIQIAAAELIHMASGQDTHIASGGAARIHTGQSIGILGGAVSPGSDAAGTGITMIAGAGDIDIQAQADAIQVAAQKTVSIQSQSAHIDWAAAKKITLANQAGASITLEGGNIEAKCPGKILIESSVRSFSGPQVAHADLNAFTKGSGPLDETFAFEDELGRAATALPFAMDKDFTQRGQRLSGADGDTARVYSAQAEQLKTIVKLPVLDAGDDTF